MKLITVFAFATLLAAGKKSKNRASKQQRAECLRGPCKGIPVDENDDCVDQCVSPKCYAEVYADEPLEPGEVDKKRRNLFTACTRREQEEERIRLQEERKRAREEGS
mmetsp:Transcript_50954/g.111630  ORF Transcript_50954/g.111630 Transcript_50954/m.111630 type:complete len:107 (-) Transcript_50954:144-464(-)